MSDSPKGALTDEDYRRLLEFRAGIRRFLHRMEERAGELGVTPAHHQLLLAVRGHAGDSPPSIGDLGTHLLLRHHSVVELVNRAVAAELVERKQDSDDHRVVRVELTPHGEDMLTLLSEAHMEELSSFLPKVRALIAEELRTPV